MAERGLEPRLFGDQEQYFGWWFGYDEGFPQGQQSALMMVAEVGEGGDWLRAFDAPNMDKFEAPMVEGIDFPRLGARQAWNDPESGTLFVRTYPTAPRRRAQRMGPALAERSVGGGTHARRSASSDFIRMEGRDVPAVPLSD